MLKTQLFWSKNTFLKNVLWIAWFENFSEVRNNVPNLFGHSVIHVLLYVPGLECMHHPLENLLSCLLLLMLSDLLFVILLLHTYLDRNVREEMLAQEIGSIPLRLKAKYVLSMAGLWRPPGAWLLLEIRQTSRTSSPVFLLSESTIDSYFPVV